MSDQLTFSWFVGTCNLAHPATGPQEALWNTVKAVAMLCKNVRYCVQHLPYWAHLLPCCAGVTVP
jgi:hypothetical protein